MDYTVAMIIKAELIAIFTISALCLIYGLIGVIEDEVLWWKRRLDDGRSKSKEKAKG